MAKNSSTSESPQRKPVHLRNKVQLVKRKDCDRYEIYRIPDTLSFEKGFFVVIHACKLLAQKNEGIVFVGVAGPSGAGKTVFTDKVLNAMPDIAKISMDNYNDSSRIIDGNFDDPRLTDYDTLLDNIHGLKVGKSVQVPIYDFKTSSRIGYRTVDVPDSRIVIIEGIYALSEKLRPLLDLRVSVTGGVHFDLVKRVLRDIQRAGQEPEEIIQQISETVYPMYKAFIEPDLEIAHIKIINKFNPFSGFQNPIYILKSAKAVTVDQIKTALSNDCKESMEETSDIYLLPPGEDPETCQSYLRMRNKDGKYNLMFEEWVTDNPFIISPRITFEVSVRLLGGLMALGYSMAAILKKSSHAFSDDRVTIKTDWLEQLNRHYIQVQARDRSLVKNIAEQLGLEGSYIPRTYIQQIQLEKLLDGIMAMPDDLKTKLSIDNDPAASPRETISWTSADILVPIRNGLLKSGILHSYSTRLPGNTERYDGQNLESSAAKLGAVTKVSDQISTLTERMDTFTYQIEELILKLSLQEASLSGPQKFSLESIPCNGSSPNSLFPPGLGNGQVNKDFPPIEEELLRMGREQRQIMHRLDNLSNLVQRHSSEMYTQKQQRTYNCSKILELVSISNPFFVVAAVGGICIFLYKGLQRN